MYPQSALTLDAAGDLFGTTAYGGPDDLGTVFELAPSAAVPEPSAGLLLGAAGAGLGLVRIARRWAGRRA